MVKASHLKTLHPRCCCNLPSRGLSPAKSRQATTALSSRQSAVRWPRQHPNQGRPSHAKGLKFFTNRQSKLRLGRRIKTFGPRTLLLV